LYSAQFPQSDTGEGAVDFGFGFLNPGNGIPSPLTWMRLIRAVLWMTECSGTTPRTVLPSCVLQNSQLIETPQGSGKMKIWNASLSELHS
jgi:hypothetical protein